MAASGLRALPWARIFLIVRIVLERLADDIPPKDRQRLAALLRRSKADPRRLTAAERREILAILRQVDAKRLSAALAFARGAGSSRLLRR